MLSLCNTSQTSFSSELLSLDPFSRLWDISPTCLHSDHPLLQSAELLNWELVWPLVHLRLLLGPCQLSSDCHQSCSSKPLMERALPVLTHFFLFWLLRPLGWVFYSFYLFTYVRTGGWSLLTGVRHTNVGEIFSTPQRMAIYKPEDCQLPDMKGASTF